MGNTHEALAKSETERRDFIVIVGEVVTGTSTVLNTVLGRLDARTQVGYLFDTKVDFITLLNGALVKMGASGSEKFPPQLEAAINRLEHFTFRELKAGRNMVMIVADAQKLDTVCLESLKLLSNLETPKSKLIQISISDQPEPGWKLQDPQLQQLSQQISLGRQISPLDEPGRYVNRQHLL